MEEFMVMIVELEADPSQSQSHVQAIAIDRAGLLIAETMEAYQREGLSLRGGASTQSIELTGARLRTEQPEIRFLVCSTPGRDYRDGIAVVDDSGYYGPSKMNFTLRKVKNRWMVADYVVGKNGLRPC